VLWLIGLAVLFLVFDEGQRVRRRVKALEERLDRLEGGEGAPS
jgi:ubiquinone biosynthesis protein UbiJ